MIEKTINGKDYLFVEVMQWATFYQMGKNSFYCSDGQPSGRYATYLLPKDKGAYEIIGKASELTEEQCWNLACTSPKSLCDFLGTKPETTLILQKL